MWMVRSGEGGSLFDDFKRSAIVAIGYDALGDLSKVHDRDDLQRLVETTYKEDRPGSRIVAAGQIIRFRFDFKDEDPVLTYNPTSREYLIGRIKGPYFFDSTRKAYRHTRKAEWTNTVLREKLSTPSRNTLGAATTIFDVGRDVEREILAVLAGKTPELAQQDQQLGEIIEQDQASRARELIKDKLFKLDPYDVQRLVAGILQAMGYKTRVSPKGADRAKDVEASPDGLGLNDPRIIVQVKHREGAMGGKELRDFIAILRPGHKALYVSSGGFTKDAKYEAERATNPVSLVDLDDLVDLVIRNYDHFDAESRVILPLTKLYWPK